MIDYKKYRGLILRDLRMVFVFDFIVLRPYLQCCRCENPFGRLQFILFLYFIDQAMV